MNNFDDQLFTLLKEAIVTFPDDSEDKEISLGENEDLSCANPSTGEY